MIHLAAAPIGGTSTSLARGQTNRQMLLLLPCQPPPQSSSTHPLEVPDFEDWGVLVLAESLSIHPSSSSKTLPDPPVFSSSPVG